MPGGLARSSTWRLRSMICSRAATSASLRRSFLAARTLSSRCRSRPGAAGSVMSSASVPLASVSPSPIVHRVVPAGPTTLTTDVNTGGATLPTRRERRGTAEAAQLVGAWPTSRRARRSFLSETARSPMASGDHELGVVHRGRTVGRDRVGALGGPAATLRGVDAVREPPRGEQETGVADHPVLRAHSQTLEVPAADHRLPRLRLGVAAVGADVLGQSRQLAWSSRRRR